MLITPKEGVEIPLVSSGPPAQSVKPGANNVKAVSSRLIRTKFHFLFALVSLFT